jgi:c-di-GMP-binding flagellar brake protein YcgR
MKTERRRFVRKAVSVEFRSRSSEGTGHLLFEGTDLSAGGAFLKSDLLLEPGESMFLEFILPTSSRRIRVQARVAWVRRFPRPEEIAGMGIEFLAISEEHRQALIRFVNSLTAPVP